MGTRGGPGATRGGHGERRGRAARCARAAGVMGLGWDAPRARAAALAAPQGRPGCPFRVEHESNKSRTLPVRKNNYVLYASVGFEYGL